MENLAKWFGCREMEKIMKKDELVGSWYDLESGDD